MNKNEESQEDDMKQKLCPSILLRFINPWLNVERVT